MIRKMKKLHFGLILTLFVACFTACTEKYYVVEPEKEQQVDKSTYTIMMYGCGGANLDKEMILNIQEALHAGTTDRVKFTGQIKFSARFQQTEVFHGTQRFIVAPTNDTWYTPVEVLDENLPLYDPQNLIDFIHWSKEQCPADEYILLLWNHGSAWLPEVDAPDSRAIIHDDVLNNRAMTLDELVQGIKGSGTKLKMIYFDACLMGQAEVLAGVSDCAEYAMCASHITPGMGGDYNSLIYQLDNSTNFEQAMAEYGREVIAHWDKAYFVLDLKVVKLDKMAQLMKEVKTLSGYLEEIAKISQQLVTDSENGATILPYDNNTLIAQTLQTAVNKSYNYFWEKNESGSTYPFYDLHMLAEYLANGPTNSYSARLIDASSRINRALNQAIISKHQTSNSIGWDFTMGITVVDKNIWVEKKYDKSYNKLVFDQATNWSKWLAINPFNPTDNPNSLTIIAENNGNGGQEGENPEGENPEGENPEGDNPEGDNPEGENPEGEGDGGNTEMTLEAEIEQMLKLIGRL